MNIELLKSERRNQETDNQKENYGVKQIRIMRVCVCARARVLQIMHFENDRIITNIHFEILNSYKCGFYNRPYTNIQNKILAHFKSCEF